MALIATASGGDFKQTPAGVYMARCHRVIDLGTQKTTWKGAEKWSRKILLQWELYGEDELGAPLTTEDGTPLSISKRYILSLSENSHLRADLKSWRGRDFTPEELAGFDISRVLGTPCMINVAQDTTDGKTYSNVTSVTPVPKAMRDSMPPPVAPAILFDTGEPNMEDFKLLSERLQATIRECREWQSKPPQSGSAAPSASQQPAFTDDDSLDF